VIKKVISLTCVITIIGLIAWKSTESGRITKEKQAELLATSDAKQFERTIRVLGDDWMGYMIFKSKVMQDELARDNIGLSYEIEPDFEKRVANLADGRADIAVMTIDSYLVNGAKKDFPGVIAYVIDESNGGDAVIGGPNVKNLNALKKGGIRGAFVGYSPSEFLLKSSVSHFQLEEVKKGIPKFRTDTIDEVYKKLADGAVDFAVLWEPQISQALQKIPGTTRLMDTAQAQGIIVDIAVYGRKFVQTDARRTHLVTEAYFKALHHYLNRPEELAALAGAYTKTPAATTHKMLAGLTFASLQENQNVWFGTTSTTNGTLIDSIQRIVDILINVGDLASDPLNANPHTITNRKILGDLVNSQSIEKLTQQRLAPAKVFTALDDSAWETLARNPIGTLIEQPIIFQRGSSQIEEESEFLLNQCLSKTVHYPHYRIVVQASVAPGNDPEEDQKLSDLRAETIRSWLIKSSAIDENRIHAQGLGSTQVPSRLQDESFRSWEKRCRFAKILLVTD
jgi:outer membrane protein OmpA-like peptidoglycan-associated protein/ABC-type taurine transport system substrate-binding protein